ncbi:MAG: Flp pilus assembly complex ATPase component TadA, partial [Verrucomicrobiota bacterium]
MDNQQIIELFQSRGLIDQALSQDILAEVGQSGKEIAEILADFQVIQHRDDIWPVVASELGASMVDLRDWTPPEALLALVPAGTARLHGALPVNFDETGLYVALVDPLNPQTPEDLRFALGREINVVVAPDYLVESKINECYGGEGKAMEDILSQLEIGGGDSLNAADLESEANSAPIIRYVDLVLYQAIKEKASDIHFEPFEKDFKIRYRVDGALYEMAPPPIHLALPILSRVKVMSNMNIAERRIPQDGRIVKQV